MELKLLGMLMVGLSLIAYGETGFVPQPDGSVTAPDGLNWGPAIKHNGVLVPMTWKQADACCNGPELANYPENCPFGADGKYLPDTKEFQTLAEQLGYAPLGGYNPAPIPDLGLSRYWSSTVAFTSGSYWFFAGQTGDVSDIYGSAKYAVRCVWH